MKATKGIAMTVLIADQNRGFRRTVKGLLEATAPGKTARARATNRRPTEVLWLAFSSTAFSADTSERPQFRLLSPWVICSRGSESTGNCVPRRDPICLAAQPGE